MATVRIQQANYFPRGMSPHVIPPQPQNLEILPAPLSNDMQLEGRLNIDIPQPVGDVAAEGRLHDAHHIDVAYRDVVGYHPPRLHDPTVQYTFPDIGHDHGINPQAQAQFNALENQGHGPFSYAQVPQRAAHDPDLAAFHDPIVHQIPTPSQPLAAAEDLRQLASRYLNHPDSRVNGFNMELEATGFYDVVIKFRMPNVFAVTTPENGF